MFPAVNVKEVPENIINNLEDIQGSSRDSDASVVSMKRCSDECQTGTLG